MMSEQVPAPEASPVPRLLLALVSVVCRFPLFVLTLSLALCALSVYASATRLQYKTSRDDLLSPDKDYQKRWQQYLQEFGDDDDIVVVVQGANRPRMQEALDTLAARVREQPEHFDRLFYQVDLRPLRNRALLFLTTEEIKTIQQNLRGMAQLLEHGPLSWRLLTLQMLFLEADNRLHKLRPGQPLPPDDKQFLTQLVSITRAARSMLEDPARYRNPWGRLVERPPDQKDLLAEPQYFFSDLDPKGGGGKQDGRDLLAFLLVRPVKDKGSFAAARKSVTAMRAIVADTRPRFPGLEFGLTGMPVLETDEMTAAEKDTRAASWLAVAGVTVLFVLVYRGVCYPLLTVATLLAGTTWAMGWVALTVGHLNILSATFAVMLIGMGDYGVLWVMRYEQARRQGADVRAALLHTATHVAVGNLTAAATLSLAFFAAMLADFRAVAELGWIAGCGVLLCALACFTVLPALLVLLDRRRCPWERAALLLRPGCRRQPSSGAPWLPGLARRPGWILAGGAALTAVLAAGACRLRYDPNLLNLQAQGLESVKWEMTLINHTKGASWHALSYTSTPEEALALKNRYARLPEVSMVVEVASLVPADQEYKLAMLREIRHRLRNLPGRGALIPHGRPGSRDLEVKAAGLVGRLRPLAAAPGAPPLLADLRDGLFALHEKLQAAAGARAAEERLRDFEQRLAGDLAEDLHALRDVATPARITLDDLPAELRDRYLGKNGKWLLRVFAKDCLWEFAPLARFTAQIRTVDPGATGKPFGTVEGLRAMYHGLLRAGLYAFGVIVAVLLLDFRSAKRAAVALAPLVVGMVLALGLLGLFGVPLNPANMIAFPLLLGVGVDNGVHVLHDYLLRRREGQGMISHAIGRGVLVKALTTMIGFGTLMISTERGLVGLGFILTLGVGCSMLTALVFLPTVMHLWSCRRPAAALPPEEAPGPLRAAA